MVRLCHQLTFLTRISVSEFVRLFSDVGSHNVDLLHEITAKCRNSYTSTFSTSIHFHNSELISAIDTCLKTRSILECQEMRAFLDDTASVCASPPIAPSPSPSCHSATALLLQSIEPSVVNIPARRFYSADFKVSNGCTVVYRFCIKAPKGLLLSLTRATSSMDVNMCALFRSMNSSSASPAKSIGGGGAAGRNKEDRTITRIMEDVSRALLDRFLLAPPPSPCPTPAAAAVSVAGASGESVFAPASMQLRAAAPEFRTIEIVSPTRRCYQQSAAAGDFGDGGGSGYFTGSYLARAEGMFRLCFDNSFSTIAGKQVRLDALIIPRV